MAISTLDNFDIRSSSSNVERDSFSTIAEMAEYNEDYLPNLFIAVCEEDGAVYLFNKNNTVDETTGKWRRFGRGYSRTLLWDSGSPTNQGATRGTTYNLSDDISNYDEILIEAGTYNDRNNPPQDYGGYPTMYPRASVSSLLSIYNFGIEGYHQRYCHIKFTNTTFTVSAWGCPGESDGFQIRPYRIFGIKY